MTETNSILEEMEQALVDKEAFHEERGLDEQPKGMRLTQKTGITIGGDEVAGRTRAWRTDDGREVSLNTAELPYHLSKRRPGGQRVFTLKKPLAAFKPDPIPGLKCDVCERLHDSPPSNVFITEASYHDHMDILHPREYQRELRNEEMAQRRRETDALVALAERGGNGNQNKQAGRNQEAGFACETCGKQAKSRAGLAAHKRGAH